VSTACWHKQCGACRVVCKFCDARCKCSCHPPATATATPAEVREESMRVAVATRGKPGDVVEVGWLDSVTSDRWQPRREAAAWATGPACATHRSVGYLLTRTADVVVLVQSQVEYDADSHDMVAEVLSIPLVAVQALTVLREVQPGG
jgi:hypothetical protein